MRLCYQCSSYSPQKVSPFKAHHRAFNLFSMGPSLKKVYGRGVQGGYKRSDINGGERNTKWDFWFGESWRSFGIDGAFREWKDYTSKSARWQGERVDTRRFNYL